MIRFLLMISALLVVPSAFATDLTVATSSGLTIVPFAVPVAVPVAVVQRPAVVYGVAAYAPSAIASPAVASSAVTAQSVPGSTSSIDDPLRAQVAPLLQRRCAECHQGAQSQGNFVLFDADGRLLEKLPRHLVVEQATSAIGVGAAGVSSSNARPTMPPGEREPLTNDEQALVRRWGKPPKGLSY